MRQSESIWEMERKFPHVSRKVWNYALNWDLTIFPRVYLIRVLLNRAPISTQLHLPQPVPPGSIQPHPPPPSSFQTPPSSLQHLRQYLNQNIARNWAISPNLGQKIKKGPFWLKIGTLGILELWIPIPDLDFWNSDPKIYFWANLGRKSLSCSFFLKIDPHGTLAMLILIPTLVFWISDPKSIFGQIWAQKFKVVCFA